MGDLLDEFMRELRRRQARERGEQPDAGGGGGPGGPDRPDDRDRPDGPDDDGPEEDLPRDRYRGDEPLDFERRRARRRSPGPPEDGLNISRRWFLIPVAIFGLLLLVVFGRSLIDLWTDIMWFRSVGYEQVLYVRLGAQFGLFLLGLVIALAFLLGNLWLAGRLAVPPPEGRGGVLQGLVDWLNEAAEVSQRNRGTWAPTGPRGVGRGTIDIPDMPSIVPIGRIVLVAFAVLAVLGVAGSISSTWETILLWQNRVPFSPTGTPATDPIFGRDIGFFMFELPFLRFVQTTIYGLLVTALLLVAGRYLLAVLDRGLVMSVPVRAHLGILGGLLLLTIAFGYQLDKLDLVYSQRGIATGVGYTDAHAQFLAYDLLTVISGLAAALLVGGALTGWVWPLGATLAIWLVASLVVGRIYPEVVQGLVVKPNALAQETPYIANNIAMTRLSFGFTNPDGSPRWDDSRHYNGDQPLTEAALTSEDQTFRNARLWDYRPLGATLDQLQTIRRYYDFIDVDTDRYVIDGVQRQVMLSARELDLAGNPNATGFVNQRIIYTHGIGLTMVPVNEVTREGQPTLIIKNLPPASSSGAPPVAESRIYFGEKTEDYVIVGAKQAEFDYPRGESTANGADTGVETRWSATTGISLGSTLNKLLFAIRFGDLNLLISDQITNASQLLMHRSLADRVPRIAPFLRFDKDPYVVVDQNGRLVYVWDAYTTSARFPHATAFSPVDLPGTGLGDEPINYIRNSVKVTMDAYDGTMAFYVADPTDPLIRAWQGVFPTVFKPLSAMPAALTAHLRVPEEMFNVQTRMYGRYHVKDPATFFRNDDLWTVPATTKNQQSLPSEAYYVIMRMPGEPEAEFLLLQPMVPLNRPNMIAWVAARNDAPNYGGVRVYNFPADTTVFGPSQIEARIDQDPVISAQITLWNQSGSQVVRGNLIVVPVGDSLLYLQPVYLQSTASAFPEFQRIIVASPSRIVWAGTLAESLRALLAAQATPGGPSPPPPSPGPSPGPSGAPGPSAAPGGSVAPSVPPSAAPSGAPGPSASALPGELPADVPGLIDYANTHFQAAQTALRAGDFATYGQEIAKVQAALQRLDQLAPTSSASPAP
ncbi:MAG: UPF0182 family protein [Chloroflexota bacterium]